MSETTTCIRGCTYARRHETDCEDQDVCRGCLPRRAEYGHLCYTCHIRLSESLQNVPGQVALLLASLMPSVRPDYSAVTTAVIPSGWRTTFTTSDGATVDAPPVRMHAKPQMPSAQESEPMRLACLDAAFEVADMVASMVDALASELDAVPPPILATTAVREGRVTHRTVWREANTYREDGRYEQVDVERTFGLESARKWLVNNLARLEAQEWVADDAEKLWEVMSRAHALAPWRDEPQRIPSIPCPYCHRVALQQSGGKEDVTCTACETDIPASRYLIWARMHEEAAV